MRDPYSFAVTASMTTWQSLILLKLSSTGDRIYKETFVKVKDMYQELSMIPVLRKGWTARICWPARTRWRLWKPPTTTLLARMDCGTGCFNTKVHHSRKCGVLKCKVTPFEIILTLNLKSSFQTLIDLNICSGPLATPATPTPSITQAVWLRLLFSFLLFWELLRCSLYSIKEVL